MWRSDGEGRYAGIEPRIPIFQRFDGRFRYARGKQIVGRRWWVVCGSRRDVGARPNLPARNSIRKSTHDLRNKSSLRRPGVAALNHTSTVFRRQWWVVRRICLCVHARPNLPALNSIQKTTHDPQPTKKAARPEKGQAAQILSRRRVASQVVRRTSLVGFLASPSPGINVPAQNPIQKPTHDKRPTNEAFLRLCGPTPQHINTSTRKHPPPYATVMSSSR